jgi:hypothetical protein
MESDSISLIESTKKEIKENIKRMEKDLEQTFLLPLLRKTLVCFKILEEEIEDHSERPWNGEVQ